MRGKHVLTYLHIYTHVRSFVVYKTANKPNLQPTRAILQARTPMMTVPLLHEVPPAFQAAGVAIVPDLVAQYTLRPGPVQIQ